MEEELRWARAGGLFDGEGHIHKKNACLDIGMCDLDVIVWLKETFQINNRICEHPQKSGKILYRLYVTGKANVKRVLTRMLPYLGQRRSAVAQAKIDWIDNSPYSNYKEKNATA